MANNKSVTGGQTYPINTSDNFINCNSSLGAIILILPSIASAGVSFTLGINDVSGTSATNNITIRTGGNDQINGATSFVIATNGASLIIQVTGNNDYVATGAINGGGGSSTNNPIIASGDFNLKDVGENVLAWIGNNTAANTAPTGAVIYLTENDTYTDNTTSFDLKQNGDIIYIDDDSVVVIIEQLIYNYTLASTNIKNSNISNRQIFSKEGNWALPVAQGTLNDFRIHIDILGERIS